MPSDTVLRWDDGYAVPLSDQLRVRPQCWAIVDQDVRGAAVDARLDSLKRRLGDSFEVEASTCDDGPYGVLYEIRARYRGPDERP